MSAAGKLMISRATAATTTIREGGCKVNPQRGDRCGRRTAIHGKLNVISKVHSDSVQLQPILEKFSQRFYSKR